MRNFSTPGQQSGDELTTAQEVVVTGFANLSAVNGDIIYYNSSAWQRLAKGTDGDHLILTSGIPAWSTAVVVSSGVYTPTRSVEANMDANVTMTEAQYMRVGSTVTVSGRFTADPTLTATATSFEITLPIASNIGAIEDVAGVAFCGAISGMGAAIIGVVANDTAKVIWVSSDVLSQAWSYSFSYQII